MGDHSHLFQFASNASLRSMLLENIELIGEGEESMGANILLSLAARQQIAVKAKRFFNENYASNPQSHLVQAAVATQNVINRMRSFGVFDEANPFTVLPWYEPPNLEHMESFAEQTTAVQSLSIADDSTISAPLTTTRQDEAAALWLCDRCNLSFADMNALDQHNSITHTSLKLNCRNCKWHATDLATFAQHYDSTHLLHADSPPFDYRSMKLYCKLIYANNKERKSQGAKERSGRSSLPVSRRINGDRAAHRPVGTQCVKCTMPFADLHALRRHNEIVHEHLRFVCERCMRCYKEEAEFVSHYERRYGRRLTSAECDDPQYCLRVRQERLDELVGNMR